MAQKVAKLGIKKDRRYLYFVDKHGNISRTIAQRGGGKRKSHARPEVVAKAGVKKESGFLYFVDKQGDISRAKMARGRK